MIYKTCFIVLFHQFLYVTSKKTCAERFHNNNVSAEYGWFAAHGSHSITLNEIQFFFEPAATFENGITMVNFNLSGDILLPNAPWIDVDNRFTSPAMFALNHVLSNMEDNNYDIKNGNALDRIAHNLHMQELWQNAAKFYKKSKLKGKRKSKLCGCLDETFSNVINASLHLLANAIRGPEPEPVNTQKPEERKMYIPVTTTPRPYGGGGGITLFPTPRWPPSDTTTPRWPPWLTTTPWNPCNCSPFEICPPCPLDIFDDFGFIRSGSNSLPTSVDNIVDEKSWDDWKDFNSLNLDDEKKAEMASSFALFMKCNLQV